MRESFNSVKQGLKMTLSSVIKTMKNDSYSETLNAFDQAVSEDTCSSQRGPSSNGF